MAGPSDSPGRQSPGVRAGSFLLHHQLPRNLADHPGGDVALVLAKPPPGESCLEEGRADRSGPSGSPTPVGAHSGVRSPSSAHWHSGFLCSVSGHPVDPHALLADHGPGLPGRPLPVGTAFLGPHLSPCPGNQTGLPERGPTPGAQAWSAPWGETPGYGGADFVFRISSPSYISSCSG